MHQLEIYTVEEVAERLKVSAGDINRLISRGRLDCVKVSKYIRRITSSQLEKFIADNSVVQISPKKLDSKKDNTGYFPQPLKIRDKVTRQALKEEMRQW